MSHPLFPKIQVNLVKTEPKRFRVLAKMKTSYNGQWQHLGGTTFHGTGSDALKTARRIAAELKEEFNAVSYEVVHGD